MLLKEYIGLVRIDSKANAIPGTIAPCRVKRWRATICCWLFGNFQCRKCLPHQEDKPPTTPSQFGWNMPWMVGKRVLPVKTYRRVTRDKNFPPLMCWFLATSQISLLIFSILRNWGRSLLTHILLYPKHHGK